ncbi:MAG: DUF4097 family beta strand repeat-containing protein [Lachnospiraceae bacterium]|nr:DUF4097 family beta strand repeat-containing protein [Lachnospiraceae bacterium]
MKGITKFIIVAGSLVGVGLLISIIGIAILSVKPKKAMQIKNNMEDMVYTAKNTDTIETIIVSVAPENIEILSGDDDDIVIEYRDDKDNSIYEIKDSKSTLKFKRNDFELSVNAFSVFDITKLFSMDDIMNDEDLTVKVYIPKDKAFEYQVNSVSGKIRMQDVKANDDLIISTTSGEVEIVGVSTKESADISTVSGDIEITDVVAGHDVSISTTSGEIRVNTLILEKDAEISTISGDVEIGIGESSDDYSVEISTVSGNTNSEKGKDRKANKEISVSTTSADVTVTFSE